MKPNSCRRLSWLVLFGRVDTIEALRQQILKSLPVVGLVNDGRPFALGLELVEPVKVGLDLVCKGLEEVESVFVHGYWRLGKVCLTT